jgi:tRNA pseudouridine55 synthase
VTDRTTPTSTGGILVLNKPAGPTSHDCVNRVRRILGTRRVGHAGTLDPMATGVLVIGVGVGTRILEYLQGLPKVYLAGCVLGIETDTQDTTGATIAEHDASAITDSAVSVALAAFEGELLQLPPMVSALKVGGRKLYELARRGETVERTPRPVTIYGLEPLEFKPGARAEASFRVHCSSGTYVRTICHDLGQSLGVGGALKSLVREAVGPFRLDRSISMEQLDERRATALIAPSDALEHLPSVRVSEPEGRALAHGQFIPAPEATPDGAVRVLDSEGSLLAIASARGHGANRLLSPEKVFASADASDPGS